MPDRAALNEQQALSKALYDTTAALMAEMCPMTMLSLILEGAQQALNVHHGLAFLNYGQLHAAASHGHFRHLPPPALEALRCEAQALMTDICAGQPWPTRPVGGGARLIVPLSGDAVLLGALVLERDDDPAFFTPERQRFLHELARQGAPAIGRAQRLIALQDSEMRARRLIQDSPVPIVTIHMDGALTEVNGAYLELLATTRDAVARGDINWITCTPPEYHATDEAAWHQAVEQGSSGPYEKVMLSGTGECIPLEVTLTHAADSSQRHVVGYLRDLRPQRAQEAGWQCHTVELQRDLDRQAQALAAQAAELEASTAELTARANVLEGMLALSRDLTGDTRPYQLIERAQQFTLDLLRTDAFVVYFEPDGSVWQPRAQLGDLGTPELTRAVQAGLPLEDTVNLWIPWQSGHPYYQDAYDHAADTPTKQTAHIRTTATLPVDVRGERRGIFAIGLKMPRAWTRLDRVILEAVMHHLGMALERAEQTQTLRYRTHALERSNRELEQFAFIASHDLQEPLRTVASFSDLLVRRANLASADPKAAQYAQLITEGTTRMRTLIQDLLTFSRIGVQSGPQDAADLLEIARDVQRHLQQTTRGASAIALEGEAMVRGDRAQLKQLFEHLLDNALKFRAPDREPHVTVTARRDGAWVQC